MKYLGKIIDKSGKYGIFSLLDSLNEKFCGERIPAGLLKNPDTSPYCSQYQQFLSFNLFEEGFPKKDDCDNFSWASFYDLHASSSAWQALYNNIEGIQDDFAACWAKVADKFHNNTPVVGYEIINEPFARNLFGNPLRMLPAWADYFNLQSMNDKVNTKIREVDKDHIVFFNSLHRMIYSNWVYSSTWRI